MENSKILQKLENIEILLTANIESMNDPQKRAKEAEILIQASNELNTTSKEIKGFLAQQKRLIEGFKPTVEHRYYTINMKNPLIWVLCCITICFVAILTVSHYINENKELKAKNAELSANNMKYKFLKFKKYDIKTINPNIKTTGELVLAIDGMYLEDKTKKDMDSLVNAREQEMKEAAEAEEIAKSKQAKADELANTAKKLTHKADSLKNK